MWILSPFFLAKIENERKMRKGKEVRCVCIYKSMWGAGIVGTSTSANTTYETTTDKCARGRNERINSKLINFGAQR